MTAFALISLIDATPARLHEARQWRDQALLPQVSALTGTQRAHVYCAFNSPQVALVAQLSGDTGASAAATLAPPSGMVHQAGLAQLSYEMRQSGTSDQEDDALLYSVRFKVPEDWIDEFDRWYEQEHLPMIYGSSYWSMTRRYRFVDGAPGGPTHLALHYLSDARGFDAPQLKASRLTPWRNKFLKQRWFTDVEKMIYFRQTPAAPASSDE